MHAGFKEPFSPRLVKLPSIKPLPTKKKKLVAPLTTTITLNTILSTVTGHCSPIRGYDTDLKNINQGKNSFLDDCYGSVHYSEGFEVILFLPGFCQASLIMMSCNSTHRILLWVFIVLVTFLILIIYLKISKHKLSLPFKYKK